ncbi:DUF1302 family protein [Nitrincola iocasae]|uniref:Uncharacterized protein n=1 Tax=Nitrincola iocasae TaxID=2614693 RepID=A0A5J6LF90_9GAMM|nr:DUF1302 family protein [Nitrincola iocasae]QEW07053.1 hypothetical protein F5I99_11335 [Nitrincola iocasae]
MRVRRLPGLAVLLLPLLLLPSLVQAEDWDDPWAEEESTLSLHGFYELGAGARINRDPVLGRDMTLAEARARYELSDYLGGLHWSLKTDLYADGVEDKLRIDLREAMVDFKLGNDVDMRLGQQVLTWGTGDMLFLNDLFAKDWQSYFSGRDDEYLKAPSLSAKASYFTSVANLDLVWTPEFQSDQFINGDRFSYFSAMSDSQMASPDGRIRPQTRDRWGQESQWAARLYGTADATEWALYAYRGYWTQPLGMTSTGEPYFPRLDAYGASARAPLAGGIANAEIAWYEGSDTRGDNARIPNDQLRVLLGYDREVMTNFNAALQYYLEWTQDYAALEQSWPLADGRYRPDEYRHLLTLRLTQRLRQDNLTLSLFTYWSPSDKDYFVRPAVNYRFDDHWLLTLGGNLFGGQKPHTFFGQFEDASSLYARLRYSY